MTSNSVIALLLLSDYLVIPPLTKLICLHLAYLMRDMESEQRLKYLHIIDPVEMEYVEKYAPFLEVPSVLETTLERYCFHLHEMSLFSTCVYIHVSKLTPWPAALRSLSITHLSDLD